MTTEKKLCEACGAGPNEACKHAYLCVMQEIDPDGNPSGPGEEDGPWAEGWENRSTRKAAHMSLSYHGDVDGDHITGQEQSNVHPLFEAILSAHLRVKP